MNDVLGLVAQHRVIVERPPPGTLRRGLVAAPPTLTAALVALALALHLGVSWRRRRSRS